LGYIASECPKKTVATFAEYQANFDSMEEPEEGADKELFLIVAKMITGWLLTI